MERLPRQLDNLERLLHALQREVLGLARDQRVVGGDERVHGQEPQRRRAVDEDEVVAVAHAAQRALEGELAAHLSPEHDLRLGEPEVGWEHAVVDSVGGPGLTRKHVRHGGRGIGRDVEVVGQVRLRVEVGAEDIDADAAVGVGERAHGGRLARAALLRENGDRLRHQDLSGTLSSWLPGALRFMISWPSSPSRARSERPRNLRR
ncbi:MAG TPA: hypothetical protein VHF45_08955 [Thermoleophilaceae bacterium]|nr:hypothetical protein [Thermoleophilaceae bacterium]